jgi:hypothetical protein
MSDIKKVLLGLLVALIGLWILAANSLFMKKVFAPEFEQVRRETFEQSKSYQDGVIQELRSMQFEYLKANPDQQKAMSFIIKHKLAGFPEDKIPSDLLVFVKGL